MNFLTKRLLDKPRHVRAELTVKMEQSMLFFKTYIKHTFGFDEAYFVYFN